MAKKASTPEPAAPPEPKHGTEITDQNATARVADDGVPTQNGKPSSANKATKKKKIKVKKVKEKAGDAQPKEQRSFPTFTLEEALKVAEAIRQKTKGKPCDTDLVAEGCGLSRKNPKFWYLTTASRDYALTTGTRDTPKIELTDLGREIVYAGSPDLEREKKIEAFFKVEKFKLVYDYYNKGGLTKDRYLLNILENQIKIPTYHHDEFLTVFEANCKYLRIEEGLRKLSTSSSDGSTKAIDIRVLGQPQGQFDKRAFVIMPFSEKGEQKRSPGFFDEVLKSLITPAGIKAGFEVQTARREDSDIIHHTIINELLNADLVIADLTDHNPNVLCELGIRLAKEKPVVIIKSQDTGAVFDVDNLMRVYIYDQNLWITTIEADVKALTERITGTWERKDTSATYMQILTVGPHAVKV